MSLNRRASTPQCRLNPGLSGACSRPRRPLPFAGCLTHFQPAGRAFRVSSRASCFPGPCQKVREPWDTRRLCALRPASMVRTTNKRRSLARTGLPTPSPSEAKRPILYPRLSRSPSHGRIRYSTSIASSRCRNMRRPARGSLTIKRITPVRRRSSCAVGRAHRAAVHSRGRSRSQRHRI